MDELDDFDELEPTYQVFRRRTPPFSLVLPVVMLIIVVAVVSGLVLGGIIQGSEIREGPSAPSTTQPTVLIAP
jgi:hypothetical protein